MKDTIAPETRTLFENAGLTSFDVIWNKEIPAVDAPNLERGGHSEVGLLELDTLEGTKRFYVKRQINHLGRSFARPLGEPTFARELRNIKRFAHKGIPALSAAWYGERRSSDGWRAILVTPELAGYEDLVGLHARWENLDEDSRLAIVASSAQLVGKLHHAGWMHGSLYAKHVFLKQDGEQHWQAQFIDLEKCRPLLTRRDRLRDLEILMRRLPKWDSTTLRHFFVHYLGGDTSDARINSWQQALEKRQAKKKTQNIKIY
ncbi:lipopolysaccharide kinase InaA family protein [Phytohalomonas tamaricis]|uniref:lipopolysaccharide kinase InaA family protein n=1 Tax=Phytohalomonas tamaricis TaxID=2081032 RepID=UPI000D0B6D16|nr:lipopolysaccharide kinase InaA family protein [Phytohalomonas tamaricis]